MRIYRSAGIRLLHLGAALTLVEFAFAQQAPWGCPNIAVSTHDRVHAADQTSNTVSVIDPFNNKLLGVIRLGNPVPGALSPLYTGQLLVHGLGYSPDSRTLAVVSIASNAVTLIDAAANKVKGTVYVGRSPHEAFFTVDGQQNRRRGPRPISSYLAGQSAASRMTVDPFWLLEKSARRGTDLL